MRFSELSVGQTASQVIHVTPAMITAVLVVCEPQYTRMLRPIVMPTIKMVIQEGILDHAERILQTTLETSDR